MAAWTHTWPLASLLWEHRNLKHAVLKVVKQELSVKLVKYNLNPRIYPRAHNSAACKRSRTKHMGRTCFRSNPFHDVSYIVYCCIVFVVAVNVLKLRTRALNGNHVYQVSVQISHIHLQQIAEQSFGHIQTNQPVNLHPSTPPFKLVTSEVLLN